MNPAAVSFSVKLFALSFLLLLLLWPNDQIVQVEVHKQSPKHIFSVKRGELLVSFNLNHVS